MGDEEQVVINKRQMLRRPKIIIRKCKSKKSQKASKTVEDCNKVNGELSTKIRGNEDANNLLNVEVLKKTTRSTRKKNITKVTVRKRKLSESVIDSDVILDHSNDDTPIIIENKNSHGKRESLSVEFKGYKKRILAQTEKSKEDNIQDNMNSILDPSLVEDTEEIRPKIIKEPVEQITKFGIEQKSKKKSTPRGKKAKEHNIDETQGDSQTEYAQYLGLQPTMQFKCIRCGERGFPSMLSLNMHHRECGVDERDNIIANFQQDNLSSAPSDPNMLTNFKLTRKVYLCSACGTYYENWNLFLHMREVHNKHICLYCLTMFGNADKLADHLKNLHNIQDTTFNSSEEFQNVYKGSCYLICCICERMFTERENYFNHKCDKRDLLGKCKLCGIKCGHYYTCPNNNTQKNASATAKATAGKNKANEEVWMGKKGQGDVYDISDAASFCHVALADESVDNENKVCNVVDLTEDSNEISNGEVPAIEEFQASNLSENKDFIINKNQDNDNNGSNENIPDKLEDNVCYSVSSESSATEVESVKEEELLQNENESCEGKPSEETGSDDGKEIIFTNKSQSNECDDLKGLNNETDSGIQSTGELPPEIDSCTEQPDSSKEQSDSSKEKEVSSKELSDTSKEQSDISKEISDNSREQSDISQDLDECITNNEGIVESTNQLQPEEIKLDDEMQSSDKNEINDESSDADSQSNDDSESSSDESTEGEKTGKVSTDSKKEASICDSDTSVTSELAVDDKSNKLNDITEDTDKPVIEDNLNESILNCKSADSSNTSKDFHLNDVSSNDKDLETEKDGENDAVDRLEVDLPGSSSPVICDGVPIASEDVPAMALTLEDKLETASSQSVVKECVRTSCLNCVYCSHAVKIAVNGKQLALHLLAEHRYKPVKNNETSQDVVSKLKTSLNELETMFFNTDSYDSSDKLLNTPYDYTYECFQCRFITKVHKELYIHKRKMHQKTVLLCVMCKSNFYSYSELLCHICPGIYVSEDIYFRCCFCNLDMIPSAFRLMVHLRKSHHACDICLDIAGDQQKLSTHMWKHKLNHLCYRCGIAYRNKPDITKHLFWKHGTESVLCKKCLQKKWPHVYHFCIPPTIFICEECNASFSKAVALKVHKRLHSGEFPHECNKCNKKFVSNKLLTKHENSHNPLPLQKSNYKNCSGNKENDCTDEHINVETIDEPNVGNNVNDNSLELSKEDNDKHHKTKKKKKRDKNSKPVLDVYDLPPLNLSSESDSSDEEAKNNKTESEKVTQQSDIIPPVIEMNNENFSSIVPENIAPCEETQTPAPIVDGVWDNFHSYKAELEKRESKDLSLPNILPSTPVETNLSEAHSKSESLDTFLLDHCYFIIPGKIKLTGNEQEEEEVSEPVSVNGADEQPHSEEIGAPKDHSSSIDHAYATLNNNSAEEAAVQDLTPDEKPATPPPADKPVVETETPNKKKQKTPKKKKHNANNSSSSSDTSSDSDSSDCTCGPNCSCSNSSSSNSSSSSSSDSDSSTSEGRRRALARKEKKKERLKHKHHKEEPPPTTTVPPPPEEEPVVDIHDEPLELPIKESDLDTNESSTDEDFYDKHPQTHAKQQLERRNKLMLLASVAPVNNGTVSPQPPPQPPPPPAHIEEEVSQQQSPPKIKRKLKTKRRRKSQQSKKSSMKANLTHREPSTSLKLPNATSTPQLLSNHNLAMEVSSHHQTTVSTFHSEATAGSGSENESARLSKRKRVRNKFYGYSSEEEEREKSNMKWRRVETVPPNQNFQPPPTVHQRPQLPSIDHRVQRPESSESSETDEEHETKKQINSNTSSSSSCSESENEIEPKASVQKEQTEKSDNLYCYCQCPYDEVSEMIACDGQDCTIEWFHFECVGIMVPPKGKWYCPDCRKRRDLM